MEVFADSHGRRLQGLFRSELRAMRRDVGVNVHFKPGKKFAEVIQGIEAVKEGRTIVVIGGTNNTHNRTETDKVALKSFNLSLLKEVSQNRKVIYVEIMRRYDRPRINEKIRKMNSKIAVILRKSRNIITVRVDDFRRGYFTKHGLHLSWKGKKRLVWRIIQAYYMNSYRDKAFVQFVR